KRAAPRRARPRRHLRADGRDQHGARRVAHDRRVRHLAGADAVPPLLAGPFRLVPRGGRAGLVPGGGRGGRAAGADRRSQALRPPAGDAARHLWRQSAADAGGAQRLRRAERGGGQPGLDVRWHHRAGGAGPALQPHRHPSLRFVRAAARRGPPLPRPPRPVGSRSHAEPAAGSRPRGGCPAHRPSRVRARLRHRRAGRLRALADRQRRARAGARVRRGLVHGRGAGRGRSAGGDHHGSGGTRPRQQVSRTDGGGGAGEDRRPRLHHPLHPAQAAGPVCASRPGGGRLMTTMSRRLLSLGANLSWPQWPAPGARLRTLFPRRTWTVVLAGYALLAVVVPVLHLAVPSSSALHVSDYAVSLGGKILCYATVALAMDLVWGYAGILSLGHGLFFALGGYAMGMYLMRAIGSDGVYGDPILPDFMVFLDWKKLPWYWHGYEHFFQQV